jgi:hypothetical protein
MVLDDVTASSSASGVSTVNGRIPLAPADASVNLLADMCVSFPSLKSGG